MTFLRMLPDIDDKSEGSADILRLLVLEGRDLEECKQKLLKSDRSCESILEKLRPCFTHLKDRWSEKAINKDSLNSTVIHQMNVLISTTNNYLNYLQSHKRYQARCSKYTSGIENVIKNEISLMELHNQDLITAIFSLIDDLYVEGKTDWNDFYELFKQIKPEGSHKDSKLTDEDIKKIEKLLDEKNDNYIIERYTLFELEEMKVIKNFSFDQQSKFFEM